MIKIKSLLFFIFFSVCQIGNSQPGITFKEYISLKDSLHYLMLNGIEFRDDHLPLLLKMSCFNRSLNGIISTIYARNNKPELAESYFKKMIYEGADSSIIAYNLNRLESQVRNKIEKNLVTWIEDYNEKRKNCHLCIELIKIFETDQKLRKEIIKLSSRDTAKEIILWKEQRRIDSINEQKILLIGDEVINIYFDIYKAYDNESRSYSDLSIYLGHYNEKALLRFKDKALIAATEKKCSWDLVEGIYLQLLFKFNFEKQNGGRILFLYDIFDDGFYLDTVKSFLEIYTIGHFLKNNPSNIIKLHSIDASKGRINILNQIRTMLIGMGVDKQRIEVNENKYIMQNAKQEIKSNYIIQLNSRR
jgi:hypothetical protein